MILDTGILDEVPIHLVTMKEIMCHVTESIERTSTLNIGYVNAHVLNLAQSNHELRAQLQSLDICYCDGLGPVLALKAHGFSPTPRLPGRLCIPQLLETAARCGWRVAWVGGERGVLDAAKKKMNAAHPNLDVVYTTHGFHTQADWDEIVTQVNAASPDILLVGMGSPIQEAWLRTYRGQLHVPVTWAVGATADYISGVRHLGPAFLLEHQEWLARLWVEPRRMWRRYLLGNPKFVVRTTRSLLWKK